MTRREVICSVAKAGFGIGVVSAASLFTSCARRSGDSGAFSWKSTAFDTEISVTVVGATEKQLDGLSDELSSLSLEIEKLFSLYLGDSLIQKLNAGEVISGNEEFSSVIKRAKQYGELTSGLFDVTVQPLWDWYEGGKKEPIEQLLELVNYQSIQALESGVKLEKKGAKVTLNGLIQGYLADQMSEALKLRRIENALINAGEYYAIGEFEGKPWEVEIRGKGQLIDTVSLPSCCGLAVSAGYGQVFGISEQAGHHIFDPSNGKNQPADLTFVVIAESAELADVIATACAASEQRQWERLAQNVAGVRSLAVYQGNRTLFEKK